MSKKKQREKILSEFFSKPYPYELDVIDRGDHLKVTSCDPQVVGWWIGALRAVYPQDQLSGEGEIIKMHPSSGVTLKLSKNDGTLRIKGKKHIEWFSENFEQVLDAGTKELAAVNEMAKQCDQYLKLKDSFTVRDLLNALPGSGAFKQTSYIYRCWRGLLDQWISTGADVYVVTPLLDAKRLSDVLLMLVKHKLSGTRVHLMCLNRCEQESRFPKVLKDAKDILRELKAPNKKRLVQEERLKMAEQRLDVRFGRFYCKLIAMCRDGFAEVMVTSASFHRMHFDTECGDTIAHFKLTTGELVNNYLAPIGLAHQVLLDHVNPFGAGGTGDEERSLMSAPSDRSIASSSMVSPSSSFAHRSPAHSPTSHGGYSSHPGGYPPHPPRPQSAQPPRSSSLIAATVGRSNSLSPRPNSPTAPQVSSPTSPGYSSTGPSSPGGYGSAGPSSPGGYGSAGPSSPHSRSVPTMNKISPVPASAVTRLSSPSINHHAVNVNNNRVDPNAPEEEVGERLHHYQQQQQQQQQQPSNGIDHDAEGKREMSGKLEMEADERRSVSVDVTPTCSNNHIAVNDDGEYQSENLH